MKITKCDRCGKLIEYRQGIPVFFVTRTNTYTYMDMCKECRCDLVAFMHNAKVEFIEEADDENCGYNPRIEYGTDGQPYKLSVSNGKEFERPTEEWIPVSERLPEERDWYLGQFKEPDTDFIGIPYICDYVGEVTKGTTNEGWILRHCTDVDNPSDYFRNLICVAWMPLPQPYKEEADNEQ